MKRQANQAKLQKIRVAQWGGRQNIYLPIYVAEQLGFFQDGGLDVEIYPAGNDNDTYEEVAAGRAHFGIGDPAFVGIGAERGDQTRVVAALIDNMCMWGLTHHAEIRPIKEPYDFAGLRIGCYPRPSTAYALLSALKRRNERMLKSMQIIEAPIGDQLGLLASGKADVALEIEPMVSLAEQRGLRVVLSTADFFPEFLVTGVMTSLAHIKTTPENVKAFVNGVQRGLTVCHKQPQSALDIATTLFPALDVVCLQRGLDRMVASRAWPAQVLVPSISWQAALALRREIGDFKGRVDPTALVDQQFAYAAITGT